MSIVGELMEGGVKGVLESLTKAFQVFKADATQSAQLEAAIVQAQISLAVLTVQAEAAAQNAVNATMQAEANAKQEHWIQWSWRPFNGYILGIGSLLAVLFVIGASYLAVVEKDPNMLVQIPTIISAIAMVLAIPGAVCGVTAWYRGQAQLEGTKK